MDSRENKRIWDLQTGDPSVLAQSRNRLAYLARLVKAAGGSAAILDIGCGNGDFLDMVCGVKMRCYGIDVSENNINNGRERFARSGKKIELARGETTALPYENGFFDAVTASEVLEHLDEKDLNQTLSEVSRVLKPGGSFIATVPSNEKLEELRCYCPQCGHSFHRYGHQQSFSAESLKELLSRRFQGADIKVLTRVFAPLSLNITGKLFHSLKTIKNFFGLMTSDTHYVAVVKLKK